MRYLFAACLFVSTFAYAESGPAGTLRAANALKPPVNQTSGHEDHAQTKTCSSIGATTVSVNGDTIRLVSQDGKREIEKTTGAAALKHLQNLKLRNPQAFIKAGENLRARGFVPTDTVYVERTLSVETLKNRNSQSGSGIVLAQTTTQYDSDGEVILWSWDDGNEETWEGEIYIERYGIDGGWSMNEGQTLISSGVWQTLIETDGFNNRRGAPFQNIDQLRPQGRSLILLASQRASGNPDIQLVWGWPKNKADAMWYAQQFGQCVYAWCAGAAAGCARRGPGFPACAAAACGGVFVACAWQTFFACCP